jgi:hypothetical protein
VGVVRALLGAGAVVNHVRDDGMTALMAAAQEIEGGVSEGVLRGWVSPAPSGHAEVLEVLRAGGADWEVSVGAVVRMNLGRHT